MHRNEEVNPPARDGRVSTGMAFTFAWVGTVLLYVACNFSKVVNLEPNEFGDFLAGAFGPVALFWLVAGYIQQGEELQQNTRALHLQHVELMHSVAEQKLLVKEQQEQTALARTQLEEQRARYAEEAHGRMLAAQPRLVLRGHYTSNITSTVNWTINVACYSNPCTDFSLSAAHMGDLFRCRSVNELRPNSRVELDVQAPKPFRPGLVDAEYRDVLGFRRSQVFQVHEETQDSGTPTLVFVAIADLPND